MQPDDLSGSEVIAYAYSANCKRGVVNFTLTAPRSLSHSAC